MIEFKISVSNSALAFFSVLMFMPVYFSNKIFDLFENVMFVICAILLLAKRYKPSIFLKLVAVYFLYLVGISFVNKLDSANIHMIISTLKIVVLLAFIEWMLNKKAFTTIQILKTIIFVLVILDFLSIILFPGGLYQTTRVWNEWHSTYIAQWIFGSKNGRIYWYVACLFLTGYDYLKHRTYIHKIMCVITMIITPVAMILVASSTSIVVSLIAEIGMLNIILRKQNYHKISAKVDLIFWLIVECFLISGVTFFLAPIVEDVLHKDLTFTGRVTIWERVIPLIMQKPICGWGYIDMDGRIAASLLGNLSFTHAHNQILNTLWQGGVIMFSLLLIIFFILSKRINKSPNCQLVNMTVFLLMALLIDMCFESRLSISIVWIFLLLCYHLPELGQYILEGK